MMFIQQSTYNLLIEPYKRVIRFCQLQERNVPETANHVSSLFFPSKTSGAQNHEGLSSSL